ncbi:hypothetical protein HY489_03015 [Candidatus Woesearchaeota archaeon]|nr:hypothetical protein [Candidatus Woesearchaeota archaeon]
MLERVAKDVYRIVAVGSNSTDQFELIPFEQRRYSGVLRKAQTLADAVEGRKYGVLPSGQEDVAFKIAGSSVSTSASCWQEDFGEFGYWRSGSDKACVDW